MFSLLHMLVDGLCAYAMYARYLKMEQGMLYILIYNFCAFALQMPIGAWLDGSVNADSKKKISEGAAYVGVLFTVLGMFTHPVILGLGNALFHVGGGMAVIDRDRKEGWMGRGLGIFVAPGAWGLFLGGQMARAGFGSDVWTWSAALLVVGAAVLVLFLKWFVLHEKKTVSNEPALSGNAAILILSVFLVVVLRSWMGFAVTFSWKNSFERSALCVLMVVLGKMQGGFLRARIGTRKAVIWSLLAAGICYLFSEIPIFGILALLFFNMTMPVTLYLLTETWKTMTGFYFGVLTFALFLGFLPYYLNLPIGRISGSFAAPMAAVLCMFSMLLLLAADRQKGYNRWR